jgi:hypothetical protein
MSIDYAGPVYSLIGYIIHATPVPLSGLEDSDLDRGKTARIVRIVDTAREWLHFSEGEACDAAYRKTHLLWTLHFYYQIQRYCSSDASHILPGAEAEAEQAAPDPSVATVEPLPDLPAAAVPQRPPQFRPFCLVPIPKRKTPFITIDTTVLF